MRALAGTRVEVSVQTGGDVSEAALLFDSGERVPLEVDGSVATGAFTVAQEGRYTVMLRRANGTANADPIRYSIDAVPDVAPTIALLAPAEDEDLAETLREDLRVRIEDDFGFSGLRLFYRLAESRFGNPQETWTSVALPDPRAGERLQTVDWRWMIAETTPLDPVPGDVIAFFLEVRDNDAVGGYKRATTSERRLRLPSPAEQYARLEEQQNEAETGIESLLRQSDAVRDEFKELRDDLRAKQKSDWEDQRQAESILQKQQQVEEQVEALSDQVERMADAMQENSLVSEETLQQYRELQKVVEEIASPELREALEALQKAMQEMNLKEMQQSAERFEFNEEQYRERLERTLDLFKKMRVQGMLEEAARRAQDLAERQERLSEKTRDLEEKARSEEDPGDRSEAANTIAQEQERSAAEMKALEEQLEKVREKMDELLRAPGEEMQRLQEALQQQALPQKMQQNGEQVRENKLGEAQQGQREMKQQLEALQAQLGEMAEGMEGRQNSMDRAGLRRALADVLTLSFDQESLRNEVGRKASDAPRMRDLTRRQAELAFGITTVADSLQKLARKIPQMSREVQRHTGETLRSMQEATEAMTERNAGGAAGAQQSSMMHLNELALLLSDLMDQLSNSQGGGGSGMSMQQMLEKMQNMAGQQQQLNEGIQQMLNDMHGNRLSSDAQERLQQMSAQQQEIRRSLEALNRDPSARGKLLGDLNKIAEQMEESIREMQRSQMSRPLVERQQQILTRLLDAQKSLQERGRERQREARTGDDLAPAAPPPLPTSVEAEEKLRRDLIRALESGYAQDYEELIRRYFDLLRRRGPGEMDADEH